MIFSPPNRIWRRYNEYRNKIAHFHCRPLDEVVFSLLRANILSFCDFLKIHFGKTLTAPDNLVLLPLGFTNSYGPLDAILELDGNQGTNAEVREFLKNITRSIRFLNEQGIEDSILAEFDIHLISVKKAKNADLIAKIDNTDSDAQVIHIEKTIGEFKLSNSPNAPEVRLPTLNERFRNFQITHKELLEQARERYSDFKADTDFRTHYKEWKDDPNCCQISSRDVQVVKCPSSWS